VDFQENRSKVFETQQEDLKRQKALCERVRQTVKSSGWKDVVAPLIDKMIVDVVGGKVGDKWSGGIVNETASTENIHYFIGYKQALMDLNNRVMFYVNEIKNLEVKYELLEKEKTAGYKMPGTDSKYNPKGKDI